MEELQSELKSKEETKNEISSTNYVQIDNVVEKEIDEEVIYECK